VNACGSTPRAIGWAAIQAAEALAAKAQEVYPDEQEPRADRASMREKWAEAVRYLRKHGGFIMDQRVPRRSADEEAA
jgi:hypothetical protein